MISGLLVTLLLTAFDAAGQHAHINAGGRPASAGSALFFVNASQFDTNSDYVIHLTPLQSPTYGPIYYGGGDVTFTSLAATPDNGGPNAFAAGPGAHVEMVFESLQGPPGGAIAFWDSYDGFFDATEISFTLPVGVKSATYKAALSENDGSAGSDPYGHIHGRKFSATLPGLYVLGLRLVDTSRNGPGGGPVHTPSDPTYFRFQAGTTIAEALTDGSTVRIRFATDKTHAYFVESSGSIGGSASWQTVAGPLAGNGRMQSVEVPSSPGSQAYFRLRVE